MPDQFNRIMMGWLEQHKRAADTGRQGLRVAYPQLRVHRACQFAADMTRLEFGVGPRYSGDGWTG